MNIIYQRAFYKLPNQKNYKLICKFVIPFNVKPIITLFILFVNIYNGSRLTNIYALFFNKNVTNFSNIAQLVYYLCLLINNYGC